MIAHIKGTVECIEESFVIIETHGVGYRIQVSSNTAAALKTGEEAKVFTYTNLREDGIFLYGFLSMDELNMFNLLISVTGVGPKVALGVLGAMKPKEITLAILSEDAGAFVKAPGIGKKTAQMIIFKLRDKIKTDTVSESVAGEQVSLAEAGDAKRDAIDALIALGYGKSEALRAVLEAALPEMKTEQIIKSALRKLTK